MPSPTPSTRRPVPRQLLERVSRPLLVRLLAPYAAALEAVHAFPLAALAASAQTDRTQVDTLWRLLADAPADLVELRDDLIAVADASTPGAHEVLLGHDTERLLDRELSAEDCAAVARLDHRPLFEAARAQTAGGAQPKAYATYKSRALRPLSTETLPEFERQMSEAMYARNRSDYFKAHVWRNAAEHHMDLVFGRLAAARDLLNKVGSAGARVLHDVTTQVTDRFTERTHAIYHDDTGELDVAGYDWFKETVRRTFGLAHFGDEAHFFGDETITLAPLADLDSALSNFGVPGLETVHLQEMWIDLGGARPSYICVGARGNCMDTAAGDYGRRALTDGTVVEATFLLKIANRLRPLKLHLVAPRKMEFDRRDPRIVRIVREWMACAGFMSVAGHDASQPIATPEAAHDDSPSTSERG
jgi:hypothetical protein